MTFWKITIDISVTHTAQSDQTQERDIKTNTITRNSLPPKQNNKISQTNKQFLKSI